MTSQPGVFKNTVGAITVLDPLNQAAHQLKVLFEITKLSQLSIFRRAI